MQLRELYGHEGLFHEIQYVGGNLRAGGAADNVASTDYLIVMDREADGSLGLYWDGSLTGPREPCTNDLADTGNFELSVGNDVHGGNHMLVHVAEAIVYNRILTEREQFTIGYYLELKYGLDTAYYEVVTEAAGILFMVR